MRGAEALAAMIADDAKSEGVPIQVNEKNGRVTVLRDGAPACCFCWQPLDQIFAVERKPTAGRIEVDLCVPCMAKRAGISVMKSASATA